ncbi:hypothetical protein [Pediococcus inopinatus]|uniref:hypothetical protein n=1 Tax=Pediococcus inopinatus TaxID=114090 RepID=UPI002B25F9DB|nr:hypothetical protein [Pediococcus inopinatus]
MTTIIDVFAHVLPPHFKNQMLQIAPNALEQNKWMENPLLSDLEQRKKVLLTHHQEILSIVNLTNQAAKPCRQANH